MATASGHGDLLKVRGWGNAYCYTFAWFKSGRGPGKRFPACRILLCSNAEPKSALEAGERRLKLAASMLMPAKRDRPPSIAFTHVTPEGELPRSTSSLGESAPRSLEFSDEGVDGFHV